MPSTVSCISPTTVPAVSNAQMLQNEKRQSGIARKALLVSHSQIGDRRAEESASTFFVGKFAKLSVAAVGSFCPPQYEVHKR